MHYARRSAVGELLKHRFRPVLLLSLAMSNKVSESYRYRIVSAARCIVHSLVSDIKFYIANYRPNNSGHQSLIAVSESCLYSTRCVSDIWQRTHWSHWCKLTRMRNPLLAKSPVSEFVFSKLVSQRNVCKATECTLHTMEE